MDIRIGTLTATGLHVVIEPVKMKSSDYDDNGFLDVNPLNRPGQPKFQVQAEIITQSLRLGEDTINFIDIEKLESLTNVFEHLVTLKKGENKIKVGIDLSSCILTKMAIQLLVLFSVRYKDLHIIIYVSNSEYVKMAQDIILGVTGLVELKRELSLDGEEFQKMVSNLYKNNLLSNTVSSIVERTYGLQKDLTGKKVILVDTHNFYYRSFFGFGAADLRNKLGEPTGLIKGFTFFLRQIQNANADYVVFLTEGHGSFRKTEYPEYKSNREIPPEDLIFQINVCNGFLEKVGCPVFKVDGFEADDGIASFAKKFASLGADVTIYSTDKDLYQLINDRVSLYNTQKQIMINSNGCVEKFGVTPDKMVEYQAIVGDTSDNIPGLKGQGPKAASDLLNLYGSLEGIYANIDKLKGKQKETFELGKDTLYLSKFLVKLYDRLADDEDLEKYRFPKYDLFKLIYKDLQHFEINL